MTYSVTIRDALEARGIELAQFTAVVRFGWEPALIGFHHDEPPHAAYGELLCVHQVEGPALPDETLVEWASDWIGEQSSLEDALDCDGGWACAHRQKQEVRKAQVAHAAAVMARAGV